MDHARAEVGLVSWLVRHAPLRAVVRPRRGGPHRGPALRRRRRAREGPLVIENHQEIPFSPTEPFRFCPADGTKLEGPRPSGGVTCPTCGRSWYRNPAPAVGRRYSKATGRSSPCRRGSPTGEGGRAGRLPRVGGSPGGRPQTGGQGGARVGDPGRPDARAPRPA